VVDFGTGGNWWRSGGAAVGQLRLAGETLCQWENSQCY
jgi:hypothetical protein